MSQFLLENWGNIATLLGIVITIWTLVRTKSAAESARKAAEATREQFSRVNTVSDFSAAIAILDEIKRLHRAGAWERVTDRYSTVRRLLVSIQTLNPDLTPEQKTILGGAIVQFRTMENQVEYARETDGHGALSRAKLNRIVSRQIDDLDK